jgi:VanZ family protein
LSLLPLRYAWLWLGGGSLLVLAVTFGSVMPQNAVRMLNEFDVPDKVLHASSYCILMLWFSGMYRRRYYWVLVLVLLGLGFALELAQRALGYRSFEMLDMAANLAGIGAGVVGALLWFGGWCQRVEGRAGARA